KMIISENRFGAEILTQKGKVYKFDDIICLVDFAKAEKASLSNASYYFTDFEGKHDLLQSSESFLLKSEALKSPMNGNMGAFSSKQSLQKAIATFNGEEVDFNALLK
ncbi:MAG: hypothetical protein V4615_01310, partial [Bacteroidota bacterium]